MIGPALALFAQLTAAQHFPQDCPTPASAPAIVSRARVDATNGLTFRAMAVPDTVYVGQQSEYQVAVFLGDDMRDRMRRGTTFFAPDMPSMLAYDLPMPTGDPPRRFANSRCYDVITYRRAIFPLLAGRIAIPPAKLVYALPLSTSFFSREESHEVSTDSVIVVAVDPPPAGRPADFAGAVGHLSLSAAFDGRAGRVGDPVRLTVRVAGQGNVKLLPRPAISVPWATLVPTAERVRVDSASGRIGGEKEFEWLVTPQEPGARELPPIRYPYFDPDLRRYQVAEGQSLALSVTAAPRTTIAGGDTTHASPALALRARDRGPVAPPAHEHPLFWAAVLLAPLPALVRRVRSRPRRLPRAPHPATVLRRATRGDDPRTLRRAWLAALAARLGEPVLAIAEPAALHRVLRRAGVTPPTAARARALLIALDGASYDRGAAPHPAGADVAALFDAIDAEALGARTSASAPRATPVLLLLLLVPAFGAALALAPSDGTEFDAGVSAYGRGSYDEAAYDFQQHIARGAAASPDAWANYGTAAWAVGDTVAATHGWERALRLEPRAGDLRDRLALVDAIAIGDPGYVPPLDPGRLALVALALWWAAWLTAAMRRRGGGTAAMATLFAMAAFTAAAAAYLVERGQPDRLGVIRAPTPLLATPETSGEPLARVERGSVVRLAGRSGRFVRVTASGGRAGWLDSERLLTLSDAPTLFAPLN